jgi:drug/metabolite transporter (DMT)-like permease
MFIGEMGCWLVVFGFYAWKSFVAPLFSSNSPLLAGGYQPVNDNNDESYESDEEVNEHSHLTDDAAPAARPLLPNDDLRTKLQGWRIFLLALPACCDITGTTLMNVGLLFVAASIYQMTRGALVLFVGLFSIIFLRRKLYFYQWLALFIVVLGVALVGLAGAIFPDKDGDVADELPQEGVAMIGRVVRDVHATAQTPEAVRAIIGVLLIAGAQIFTASQFVLEEWILEHYAMEPLKVVGWEGIFGFTVTLIGMFILHLIIGQTEHGRYGYFDAKEGWKQMVGNKTVLVTSLFIMLSIGYVSLFPL